MEDLRAHLLGPDHALGPRSLERFEESTGTDEAWLLATHLTHHVAPYAPAVPHDLEL